MSSGERIDDLEIEISDRRLPSVVIMSETVSTINVINIPLFNGTIQDATSYMIDTIGSSEKRSLCISATGAHGMVTSQKDPSLNKILNEFHINLADGMPGVWMGKMKGAKRIARCYGPDFFEHVLRQTASGRINHYFCGGKEGVAEELLQECGRKFDNRNIVGVFSPPFREMTEEELTTLSSDIESRQTDVVWVGISTPKQEKFAYRLSKRCRVHFIVTVGAAFDFHIGNVKQAPKFIQNIGMEWLFRLCVEPGRLWRRYVNIVPMFMYYNLIESIGLNKKQKLT